MASMTLESKFKTKVMDHDKAMKIVDRIMKENKEFIDFLGRF